MVADIVGSKAQNRIPMGYGRVLLRAVRLKRPIIFVVLPAVDLDDELANLQVKAVPRNERVVLRKDPVRAKPSAELALRYAIGPNRRASDSLFQAPGNPTHPSPVIFEAGWSCFAAVVRFQQLPARRGYTTGCPQHLNNRQAIYLGSSRQA